MVILRDWRSGVATNPWSFCGVASLSLNDDVRCLFAAGFPAGAGADASRMPVERILADTLSDRRFQLGYFYNSNGNVEYGIVLAEHQAPGHPLHFPAHTSTGGDKSATRFAARSSAEQPFFMLGYLGRFLFLFILGGLLAVILYYNNTGGDTPFENFMDGQSFGVRFLFTGVGVLISLFWGAFFGSKPPLAP
jgi:hypothetical protein